MMSRILLALLLCAFAVRAQTQAAHPTCPGKGQLFVGTCYQPVDRLPEEIKRDIALMQAAGFRMVRIGDLAWDSIEPSEGDFQFALYDSVMEQMNQAGIKVIFDISGLPAPVWLHHKYPSVDWSARRDCCCASIYHRRSNRSASGDHA